MSGAVEDMLTAETGGAPGAPASDEADRDLSPLLTRLPEVGPADAIFGASITALYTGQEVDWARLSDALNMWRPALDAIARRLPELEPGSLRVPQAFIRRTWRLLDVYQCEAHWQVRHGDPAKPIEILTALLALCQLMERAPASDACLARHHAALLTRSMVLASFRDPRLFHGMPECALEDGLHVLAGAEPDLASFRAAVEGEAGQYVAAMGATLYDRRGQSYPLAGGQALPIPATAGGRGLWLESAREAIHDLMRAALPCLGADHQKSLAAVSRLVAERSPSPLPFVNEALTECGLMLVHAHRIWVHNVQGHRILSGMMLLERVRSEKGAYPPSLALAQAACAHDFRDPLTGGRLRYTLDSAGYRLEISPESAALLSAK